MSIRTSIELDDGVSKNLMRIYHSLQLTINGFEALQRQMNRMQPVSIDAQINIPDQVPQIHAPDVLIHPIVDEVDIPKLDIPPAIVPVELSQPEPIPVQIRPEIEDIPSIKPISVPIKPTLDTVPETTAEISQVVNHLPPQTIEAQLEVPDEISIPKVNAPAINVRPTVVEDKISPVEVPTVIEPVEVKQPKLVTIHAIVDAKRLKIPPQMVTVEPVVKGIEQLPEPPTIQANIEPLVDEIPPVELTATINSGNIDIPQIEITATPTFDNVVNLPVIPVIDDNIELEPIAMNVEPILSSIPRVDIPDTTVNVQPQINQMPNIPPIRATIEPVGNLSNNNGNNSSGQWNSPENVEVFNGNGMERYTREIQSATEMTNRMAAMQQQIQSQANNTHLFPPNMVADLSNMNNRVASLRTSLEQLANRPIDDMGAEQANREIESLRQQLSRAVHEQGELTRAMERMDISAANAAYNRLNANLNITEREIRDNINAQEQFNQRIREGANGANALWGKIKGIAAAYLGMQGISSTIQLSDQLTNTSARLNLIVDDGGSVEELQDKIFAVAENSRAPFLATADMVSKLGMQASDAFANNDELLFFTEQINKQFAIAGTSTQGIESVMLQLTQAMAAGKLQGEELNAVLDNAQPIVKNIADYMGVPVGEIKKIASEGQITAEIIKNAMFAAADETNAKFESMPMTFGQIATSIRNHAVRAFEPVLKRINEIGNSEVFSNMVNRIVNGLYLIASWATKIFNIVTAVGSFVANNWSMISPIIMGIVAALGVYYGRLLLLKSAILAVAVAQGVLTLAKMLAVPVYAIFTGSTMLATAAQWGLNTALYACPIVWIIILIIALIAIIYVVCAAIAKFTGVANSGFGVICGGVNVVIQFFKNLGLTVANIAIGIGNASAALCINIMTAFRNAISSVQSWWYDLLSTALTVIEGICEALNKLPFVEFDYSGITAKAKEYAAKAKEAAGNKEKYKDISDAFNKGFNKFDTFQDGWASTAFSASAAWGDNKIGNLGLNKLGENIPGFNLGDTAGAVGPMAGDVGKIADNTGAMKDSLDMSEEDLKYLRDIAEQEVINRFTTAELKIDFTNHNAINSNLDLDGVVSYIEDKVTETLISTAEGVHV